MITIKEVPDYVFYDSLTYSVEWYVNPAGRIPAKEYCVSLSTEEQQRLYHLVIYLADSPIGTRLPRNLYNEEDSTNKIYALKPKEHRFFNFMAIGKKIIIVAGYRKHSQQMTKKDLNLLRTVVLARHDYLSRIKAGTYYEGLT